VLYENKSNKQVLHVLLVINLVQAMTWSSVM